MGAIYFGWATPTEAAGAGVVLSLGIAAVYRGLSWRMLHEAFLSTMRTSALCLFIITSAFYLNFVIGVMGVPQAMTDYVAGLGVSKLGLILVLVVFYLVLGCFIETLSMMVGTIPMSGIADAIAGELPVPVLDGVRCAVTMALASEHSTR